MKLAPFACVLTTDLTTGATICHVRERQQNNELTALANNGVLTLNKRYYFCFLPTESHRAPYRGDVRRTEGPTSHLTLAMRILYDA